MHHSAPSITGRRHHGTCLHGQLAPWQAVVRGAYRRGNLSGRHFHPQPAPEMSLRAAPNSDGVTNTASSFPRTLYDSRTAVGQELLRLLLDAPDVGSPTAASDADAHHSGQNVTSVNAGAGAGAAPADCITRTALLVRQVGALMTSHPDMAALLRAMASSQERVNQVRSGGGGGGSAGRNAPFRNSAGFGPKVGTYGGGSFGGGSGRGGGGGGDGGSTAAAPARSPKPGGIPSVADPVAPPRSLQTSTTTAAPSLGSPAAHHPRPSPAPPSSQPQLQVPSAGRDSQDATPAAAGPSGAHGCGDGGGPPGSCSRWDWRRVRRVVVVGLGSLAAYQSALRSGRQTERESTRAAARVYQLALSLVLTSPSALPGLRDTGAATGSIPTSPGDLREAVAVDRQSGAAVAQAGGATVEQAGAGVAVAAARAAGVSVAECGGESSGVVGSGAGTADGGERRTAEVMYFDPEYLDWDVRLVEGLWRGLGGDDAMGDGYAAEGRDTVTAGSAQHSSAGPPARAEIINATAANTAAPLALLTADSATLFYAPCCPRELYDSIVRCNLAAGTLQNVALVGNSLRAQSDAALLLRAFGGAFSGGGSFAGGFGGKMGGSGLGGCTGQGESGGEEVFVDLVADGRVVEVMLPDFAAHGVATALHLFA